MKCYKIVRTAHHRFSHKTVACTYSRLLYVYELYGMGCVSVYDNMQFKHNFVETQTCCSATKTDCFDD